MGSIADPDEIKIGPFRFTFWPDGQDPGVGMLVASSDTFAIETRMGAVTRVEWDEFVRGVPDQPESAL